MFGGNIRGKIISAEPGQKLVQSWQLRSPDWPSGQYCGSEVNVAMVEWLMLVDGIFPCLTMQNTTRL
jgi:activator of HSP90 ATPase